MATWESSSEGFASFAQVLDFLAVFFGAVEGSLGDVFVTDGNVEARPELAKFLFVQLFTDSEPS